MAKPSSKYDVKSQITIGSGSSAFTVNATDTYKNLYPKANTAFDSTILYTKTVAKDLLNVGVPEIQGNTHTDYMRTDGNGGTEAWYASGSGSTQYKVWDLVYNPYPKMGLDLGYTIVYKTTGSYGRYYWGKNEVVETTIAAANDMPIIRDWKYNELVFYFPIINVVKVEDVENYINNFTPGRTQSYPASTRVTLTELYNNPDKYYVESFTTGAWIWNPKTNKYVANNNFQIIANINTPNQSVGATGIQNVINLIKTQRFPYSGQSPYYVNLMFNATSTSQVAYGRNGFSEGIPKGLSTEYNYMLGYPSLEYKHTVIRNKIQQALDDITNSASGATSVAEYYIEIEKIHEDDKCIMYSFPYVSGGTNADHSRQWMTTYQWKPVTFIKGSFFLKFIGSFGLYVTNDSSTYMSTATPETLANTTEVYLGEMNSKGFTTGRLIPWTELDKYEGYNKEGSSVNPDFDPEGGGGEDKYDLHDDTLPNVHPNSGLGSVQGRWFYTNDPQTIGNISELYTDADPVASWSTAQKILYLSQALDKVKEYGKDALVTAISFPFSLENKNGINIKCSGTTMDWIRVGTEVFDLAPDHDTFGQVTQVNLVTKSKGAPITSYNPILNAGSFNITPYGNDLKFIDFEPYTTIQLHLPFVGWVPLSCSQVMGKTIYVEYHVDLWTATAVAYVLLKNGDITTAIASYPCTIGTQIAIDKTQYANYMSAMLDCMTAVTATAASAGMGNAFGTVAGLADIGASIANGITNACNPQMSQVGSRGSAAEVFSSPLQTAVAIYRPEIVVPDNYGHTVGFACEKDATLSSLSGYTVCSGVDTSGINATDSEKARLKAILESGFYA